MVPEYDVSSSDPATSDTELNLTYLRARKLVVLDYDDNHITIGSSRELAVQEISAIEFATGLEVRNRELAEQEIITRLLAIQGLAKRGMQGAAESLAVFEPLPVNRTVQLSLIDRVRYEFARRLPQKAALLPIAQLLEAGYPPLEAGRILVEANAMRTRSDIPASALERQLASGTLFGEAVLQDLRISAWIRQSIKACHAESQQIAAFIRLAQLAEERAKAAAAIRTSRIECGMFWVAVVLGWFAFTLWTGILAGVSAWAGLTWYRASSAANQHSDFTRAQMLELLEAVSSLELPPSVAIRASMSSLDLDFPTWGSLPDTREGLADALDLPPLSRALLMKGELSDAAGHAAQVHSERSSIALVRCHWWNTRLALCGFGLALTVLALA